MKSAHLRSRADGSPSTAEIHMPHAESVPRHDGCLGAQQHDKRKKAPARHCSLARRELDNQSGVSGVP